MHNYLILSRSSVITLFPVPACEKIEIKEYYFLPCAEQVFRLSVVVVVVVPISVFYLNNSLLVHYIALQTPLSFRRKSKISKLILEA